MGSKRLARLTAACALVCSSHLVAAPPLTAPAWNDLTPDQQRTLSPWPVNGVTCLMSANANGRTADRFPLPHAGGTVSPPKTHGNLVFAHAGTTHCRTGPIPQPAAHSLPSSAKHSGKNGSLIRNYPVRKSSASTRLQKPAATAIPKIGAPPIKP